MSTYNSWLTLQDEGLEDVEMLAKPNKCQESRKWTLAQVFEELNRLGPESEAKVTYEYDLGDGWEHDVRFVDYAEPDLAPSLGLPETQGVFCISGEGHPCAEDCGGEYGWEELKELFADPEMEDPSGRRRWYKRVCANGNADGLDPHQWDIQQVNVAVGRMGPKGRFPAP